MESEPSDFHKSQDAYGHLLNDYLPAMYWDSSVIIDYWISGIYQERYSEKQTDTKTAHPDDGLVEQILKLDENIQKMYEIRKRLNDEKPTVLPVITPLSLLELMKWNADERVKKLISEISLSGVSAAERQGKRRVAEKLSKIYKLVIEDESDGSNPFEDESPEKYSINRRLFRETILDPYFADRCGLMPLVHADIIQFNFTLEDAWSTPSVCAFLQVGGADIMHIMLAKHLGCKYLATFDSDFIRVKEPIFEDLGIRIISSHEEIMSVLYSKGC